MEWKHTWALAQPKAQDLQKEMTDLTTFHMHISFLWTLNTHVGTCAAVCSAPAKRSDGFDHIKHAYQFFVDSKHARGHLCSRVLSTCVGQVGSDTSLPKHCHFSHCHNHQLNAIFGVITACWRARLLTGKHIT